MPAESFDDIYNIEPAIETALKTIIEAEEVSVVRTTDAATDFQKLRPRVELEYIHTDLNQSNSGASTYYRSRLWSGQLNMLIVTNAKADDDGGMNQHFQIRARMRNVMAKLRKDLISTYPTLLPWHTVELVREQGTSPSITPQDGSITSQMTFEFQVNVKPDAWPAE